MRFQVFFSCGETGGCGVRQDKIFFYKKRQAEPEVRVVFYADIVGKNFFRVSFRQAIHKGFVVGEDAAGLYITEQLSVQLIGRQQGLRPADTEKKKIKNQQSCFSQALPLKILLLPRRYRSGQVLLIAYCFPTHY